MFFSRVMKDAPFWKHVQRDRHDSPLTLRTGLEETILHVYRGAGVRSKDDTKEKNWNGNPLSRPVSRSPQRSNPFLLELEGYLEDGMSAEDLLGIGTALVGETVSKDVYLAWRNDFGGQQSGHGRRGGNQRSPLSASELLARWPFGYNI